MNSLNIMELDTIYLVLDVRSLEEIEITARAQRSRPSDQIIKRALDRLPENLVNKPVTYKTYYREYMKQGDDYINLFESVINLKEPDFSNSYLSNQLLGSENDNAGIQANNRTTILFNANLLYKRLNRDFKVDSLLFRHYDNQEKYVPFAQMGAKDFNELAILRVTDPIRNYDRFTFSFVNVFSYDFLRNHEFDPPRLAYMDDRVFYYITFTDNRNYAYGMTRVKMYGYLYIDAENFGIKKFNYRAVLNKGMITQRLFELNVEYKMIDGKYYLHYDSYNNLYKSRNFILESAESIENGLQLLFSDDPDPETAEDPSNYEVLLQGFRQDIKRIKVDDQLVILEFENDSEISEILKQGREGIRIFRKRRIRKMDKWLKENLSINFSFIRDINGRSLSNKEFSEYYQYREIFVNDQDTDSPLDESQLMDPRKPVILNEPVNTGTEKINWLNTPLLKEDLNQGNLFSSVKVQNDYLENQLLRNEARVNEIVYIHTDREVYSTDDTLWFKSYIRNRALLTPSNLSRSFYVQLVDSTGTIIKEKKYMTSDSEMNGHFLIDHSFHEGTYYLTGYSSWMKNFEPDELFARRFIVREETRDDLHLMIAFNRKEYFPGDTVWFQVQCFDELNRTMDEVPFIYRIEAGNRIIDRGSGATSSTGRIQHWVVLPDVLDSESGIFLRSDYKMENMVLRARIPVNYFINVGFYPEGGQLINGSRGRVAFKAVTREDRPIDFRGEIIDRDGRVIREIASEHDGLGEFQFRPEKSEDFYLKISEPAGFDSLFLLPQGVDIGWQLSVRQSGNKILARINHTFNSYQIALITLSVRGYLSYYKVAGVGKEYILEIPLENIPPGVGVLTVFDENLVPCAERLVFIGAPDPGLTMGTRYASYLTRDSVTLVISGNSSLDLSKGRYSLSVYDDLLGSSMTLDEGDIRTGLLVSPEIKGGIYNINSYLDPANENSAKYLDLLLMTQGWRKYELKEYERTPFPVPRNMDRIYGHLSKPGITGTTDKIPGNLKIFFAGESYNINLEEGKTFNFGLNYTPNTNSEAFLSATDHRGSDRISIILDSTEFEKGLGKYLKYLADSLGRYNLVEIQNYNSFTDHFSRSIENHQWLEEVVIRKTRKENEFSRADLALRKREATRDELESAIDMEHLAELIYVPNTYESPVFYVIDGILQERIELVDQSQVVHVPDYTWVNTIDPRDIESYTVVRGAEVQALYGFGIEYVIDVDLKPSSERNPVKEFYNPVRIKKFELSKEFYQPLYDTEFKRKSTFPDLRKTILWMPDVVLEEDGETFIRYYNGDRYTRIRCVLEGITNDGIPVHTEHLYEVSITRE